MSSPPSSRSSAPMPSFLPTHPSRTRIREGFLKTLRRTFHHRWLLGFLCLLSLITGYFTARIYGTALWEATQYVIYLGDPKEGVTPEQMFEMAMSEARNPVLIKQVVIEVDPELSHTTFQRNFTATAGPQPNAMILKLKWNDRETARNLLSAFIVPYQQHLKRSQISTFDREGNPVIPSADSLGKLEAEIALLRQKQREDLATQGVTDFPGDIAARKLVMSAAENQIRDNEQKLTGLKARYRETLRQLEDLKKYAGKEAEVREQEETMNGNVPANPHRQQRLRELIAEENVQIELAANLNAKNLEKKDLEELVKKGKASPESVLRVGSEIAVIKAKLDGNKKTNELYNEIIKLDRAIMPDPPKKTPLGPIFTQMVDKKFQLELDMLAIPEETDYLRSEIDVQKAKLATLAGLEGRFTTVNQKVARREQEHRSIQAEINRLTSNRALVVPFGEASVTPFPVSSNRQTMFATIFLSGSALSVLAVFLYELVMGIRLPSDIARSLRLPVRWIAANPEHAAADYRELCRIVRSGGFLAKTILQMQPLTQGPGAQAKTAEAIEGLAAAFAKRGEKVLVIDLCDMALQSAGLTEMMLAPEESIERLIQPGDASGVFRMHAGRQELTATQLADPALRACLEKIAATYSVILIQGHGLQAIQEVEALGLAAHGLVIVSDGDRKIEPTAREALVDLTAENLSAQVLLIV